jgi:hypothetical protein
VIILIPIGILYEYNKIAKKRAKKIANTIVNTWFFVVVEALFYTNTRTIEDYLILNLVALIYGILIFILYKKREKVHMLANLLLITGFAFIIAMIVNYYFIRPIDHFVWIAPIVSFYLGTAIKKYKNKTIKLRQIVIYGFIAISILVGLFKIFDESILGTSRVAREVKTFLIQQEGYEEEEIDLIYNFQLKKGFPESVEVKFSNGEYIFYEYKDNRISETTIDAIMESIKEEKEQ